MSTFLRLSGTIITTLSIWTGATSNVSAQDNDECAGAVALTEGVTYSEATFFAGDVGDPLPTCVLDFGNAVWFTYTPTANGILTISTCASDFDTALQVYTGDCGSLVPVPGGCDDDDGPACIGYTASVRFNGTGGTTYRIMVGGYGGEYGDLEIVATLSATSNDPNLTPYQPPGWTDKLVVSTVPGTASDSSPIFPTNVVYLDFSVINTAATATPSGFGTEIYVDDVLRTNYASDIVGASAFFTVLDYPLGALPAGTHTIRIKADAANIITESDESDNEYSRTIIVTPPGPAAIRITPLSLTFSNASASYAPAPWRPNGSGAAIQIPAAASIKLEQKLTDAPRILDSFTNGPTVPVVVNLTPPEYLLATSDFSSRDSLRLLRTEMHRRQQEVIDGLSSDEVKPGFRYDNIAAFSAEVTLAGLMALQAHEQVMAIEPVFKLQPHLAQGISLIHGMTYRSVYNGSNMAIAIVDTGIDYTHPRLGGGGFPNTKVIGGYDFGDDDGDPLPSLVGHGTCCAGIAAGDLGAVGDYIGGVAYGATLYALKITSGNGSGASTASMIAAWDWCVTHKNDNPAYPIMVISTSFGGGRFFDSPTCDLASPSMTAAAQNANLAGITVLASSGNDGYCDSLAWPACISSVIAVGAVYDAPFGIFPACVSADSCATKFSTMGCFSGFFASDNTAADKVTSYSNASTNLAVLAPGNQCYTTDIVGTSGESPGDYDDEFGGTSAASPYVAGAVACLQSAAKALTGSYLTPTQVRDKLINTGNPITDSKVALTRPRVNLQAAIESLQISSQTFRIYNDGGGTLMITSIVVQSSAPWLITAPSAPPSIEIPGGGYQDITVLINWNQTPQGIVTNHLLITSNVATNSPYPNGVYITTINGKAPVLSLSGITWSNGVVRFALNGPAGSNCVVHASTNLVDWQPIWTNQIDPGGSVNIADPNAAMHKRRFYRAQLQ